MTDECGVLQSLDMKKLDLRVLGSECKNNKQFPKTRVLYAKNIELDVARWRQTLKHPSPHKFFSCSLILRWQTEHCSKRDGKFVQHLIIPLLSIAFVNKHNKEDWNADGNMFRVVIDMRRWFFVILLEQRMNRKLSSLTHWWIHFNRKRLPMTTELWNIPKSSTSNNTIDYCRPICTF